MLSSSLLLSMSFAKSAQQCRRAAAAVTIAPSSACSISLTTSSHSTTPTTTSPSPLTSNRCKYAAMAEDDGRDCFVPHSFATDPSFYRSIAEVLPSLGLATSSRIPTYRQRRAVSGTGVVARSSIPTTALKAKNTMMSAAVYQDAHFIDGAIERALIATRTSQIKRHRKLSKSLAAQMRVIAAATARNKVSSSSASVSGGSKMAWKAAQ